MALGSVVRDMQEMVKQVDAQFKELVAKLNAIEASQKRLEATIASLITSKEKR